MAALFCAPLFVHLGRGDLQGDEPIYAFAVDLMVETGDWLTPRSIPDEHAAFLEKPPLKFWIVAASIRSGLLPHSDFGQRFWDAVFGAAAFLYVFAFGVRLAGPACGLLAVFTLFVHRPFVFDHGLRSQNMEAALVLSYCGGLYHALAWASASTPRERWLHPLAVMAFFVLGFMTKFVAAVFLPLIIGVMVCLFGNWRRRLLEDWRAWTAAILLAIVVTAPWFVFQTIRRGDAFWDVLLGVHVYQRMTAYVDPAHLQPWHYYFSTLYSEIVWNRTLLPTVLGAAALVVVTVRRRWDAGVLVLTWFLVPFVLISLGTSKLYHYAYPFLPPLGLAAGFLPALLVHRSSPLRQRVEAWGARLSSTFAWARLDRERVPRLNRAAVALAVVAFVVAAVTLTYGRFGIRIGDVLIFRNASIARPLLIGVTLLILSSRGRMAARLTLVLLVLLAVPLDAYRNAIEYLDERDAPVRRLATCVQQQVPADEHSGLYAHADDLGQWKYVYYFRKAGWDRPHERPLEALVPKLFDAEQHQPVLLSAADYRALERTLPPHPPPGTNVPSRRGLLDVASFPLDDSLMVLLPGRFAVCAPGPAPRR